MYINTLHASSHPAWGLIWLEFLTVSHRRQGSEVRRVAVVFWSSLQLFPIVMGVGQFPKSGLVNRAGVLLNLHSQLLPLLLRHGQRLLK